MTDPKLRSREGGRGLRFLALVRKESLQVARDPSSILIAFVLPLILLFLFGYGISLDTTDTRVGVVIEDVTPVTSDLAASFQASRYFSVVTGRDRREFEEDLVRLEPRESFPADIEIGMQFVGSPVDGSEEMLYTVTDVAEDKVVVDGNHPYAGQAVHFQCVVADVRAATADEVAHRHAHGAHGHHHH